jgi:hypothetical protein
LTLTGSDLTPAYNGCNDESSGSKLTFTATNATTYYDTGFMLTSNMRVVTKQNLHGRLAFLFGSRYAGGASPGAGFSAVYDGGESLRIDYGSTYTTQPSGGAVDGTHVYDMSKAGFYQDGTRLCDCPSASQTFTNTGNTMTIGYAPTASPNYLAKGDIYWLKVYNNTTLIHDYVPYAHNGQACLYDTVAKTWLAPRLLEGTSGAPQVSVTGDDTCGKVQMRSGDADSSPATAAVTLWNGTTITCTAGAHAPGPVDIVMQSFVGSGQAGASLSQAYTYLPTVSGLSPLQVSSCGGEEVTATGSGFKDALSSAGMPSSYPAVHFTDGALFDCGFALQGNMTVEVKAQLANDGNAGFMFGSRGSSTGTSSYTYSLVATGGALRADYKGAGNTGTMTTFGVTQSDYTQLHTYKKTPTGISMDGTKKATWSALNFTAGGNLWIGYAASNGGANYLKGDIYYLKVWNASNQLIHDYEPATDANTGMATFHDTVTDTYLQGQIGSSPTATGVVPQLPQSSPAPQVIVDANGTKTVATVTAFTNQKIGFTAPAHARGKVNIGLKYGSGGIIPIGTLTYGGIGFLYSKDGESWSDLPPSGVTESGANVATFANGTYYVTTDDASPFADPSSQDYQAHRLALATTATGCTLNIVSDADVARNQGAAHAPIGGVSCFSLGSTSPGLLVNTVNPCVVNLNIADNAVLSCKGNQYSSGVVLYGNRLDIHGGTLIAATDTRVSVSGINVYGITTSGDPGAQINVADCNLYTYGTSSDDTSKLGSPSVWGQIKVDGQVARPVYLSAAVYGVTGQATIPKSGSDGKLSGDYHVILHDLSSYNANAAGLAGVAWLPQ